MSAGLRAVAAHAWTASPTRARERLARVRDADNADLEAMSTMLVFLEGRYDEAVARLGGPHGPGEGTFPRAVRKLVHGLCLSRAPQGLDADTGRDDPLADLVGTLAVQTAIGTGQIELAAAHGAALLARPEPPSVFRSWTRITRAYALCFVGDTEAATGEYARVRTEVAAWPNAPVVSPTVDMLVLGQTGRHEELAVLCETLLTSQPRPRTYLEGIAFLLAALAQSAAGNVTAAAELLQIAGGGPLLRDMPLSLRPNALDMVVESSMANAELDRAFEALAELEALPVFANPMASASMARARARVDPMLGPSGRPGETYETRMRMLQEVAHRSREAPLVTELARIAARSGSDELRAWADEELARLGSRLRDLPGIGWDTLSAQQHIVARLAAQGQRNRQIATALGLSERTVENHVAAVLAALGSTGRVGIGERIPAAFPAVPAARLTDRQHEVAALVAEGLSNAEVAVRLGVGTKAVEKQVSRLFAAYGVSSRSAVAARFKSAGDAPAREHPCGSAGEEPGGG